MACTCCLPRNQKLLFFWPLAQPLRSHNVIFSMDKTKATSKNPCRKQTEQSTWKAVTKAFLDFILSSQNKLNERGRDLSKVSTTTTKPGRWAEFFSLRKLKSWKKSLSATQNWKLTSETCHASNQIHQKYPRIQLIHQRSILAIERFHQWEIRSFNYRHTSTVSWCIDGYGSNSCRVNFWSSRDSRFHYSRVRRPRWMRYSTGLHIQSNTCALRCLHQSHSSWEARQYFSSLIGWCRRIHRWRRIQTQFNRVAKPNQSNLLAEMWRRQTKATDQEKYQAHAAVGFLDNICQTLETIQFWHQLGVTIYGFIHSSLLKARYERLFEYSNTKAVSFCQGMQDILEELHEWSIFIFLRCRVP